MVRKRKGAGIDSLPDSSDVGKIFITCEENREHAPALPSRSASPPFPFGSGGAEAPVANNCGCQVAAELRGSSPRSRREAVAEREQNAEQNALRLNFCLPALRCGRLWCCRWGSRISSLLCVFSFRASRADVKPRRGAVSVPSPSPSPPCKCVNEYMHTLAFLFLVLSSVDESRTF